MTTPAGQGPDFVGARPSLPPGPPVPDDRLPGDTTVLPQGSTQPMPSATPAQTPRPASYRRRDARPWLVAGLGATLLLSGAAGLATADAVGSGPFSRVVEHETLTHAVDAISVTGGSSDIEVRGGAAAGTVEVTRRMSWGPFTSSPYVTESWEGNTLQVLADCDGWCSIDYVLQVPDGTAASVETGSGGMLLEGRLGDLTLRAGSGDLEGNELSAGSVNTRTGSGDIDLSFASEPASVTAEAGSGDVSVRVPEGSYGVAVTTGSGIQDITVNQFGDSSRPIRVETGSGDVDVSYR